MNIININKVKRSAQKLLYTTVLPVAGLVACVFSSCNDKMDESNYYTFTGKMMSEYLKNNDSLSIFSSIVEKAGLMDQLSAYGHYTCFAPTNTAMEEYLANDKKKTLDQLTKEDCDTIARTHLIGVMYSSIDLANYNNLTLGTQNMMQRNLKVSQQKNKDGKTEFVINNSSVIRYELQDDSVENGIVQPVSKVIVNSTSSIANLIKSNCSEEKTQTQIGDYATTLYYKALQITGIEQLMDTLVEDRTYNYKDYPEYKQYNTGAEGAEWAIAPKKRKYGFTVFLCPDKTLAAQGITTIEQLYQKANEIYNADGAYSGSIDDARNPENPLYQFMAYHVLNRNVQAYNYLTMREDLGVDKNYANTTEWYNTLLPGSLLKVEHLINTNRGWLEAGGIEGERFANRRIDDKHRAGYNGAKGVHIINPSEEIDATNGIYFYIDDILKFDDVTRDIVCNTRIRMDMSTFFPELASNNIRLNGKWNNYDRKNLTDDNIGYNYYFPDLKNGKNYLDGVKVSGTDALFVYRRPRLNFYSMHGDEMNGFGVFDITFNLPPFPFEGYWQLRLGFAPMSNAPRGAIQIYFDDEPTGIPLNMDLLINSEEIYGTGTFPSYSKEVRNDSVARTKDFKILKNKGYYRGPFSIFHANTNDASAGEKFADQPSTVRKVLCTVNIPADQLKKTHTLRIKNVSLKNAANKEAMLDYIEFVPRSVYGIGESGETEDDL